VIDAALEEVNEARGEAGALQGNTIERVLDSLRVGSQNLSEFESILRDVDMAAESAEYARVQVMVQAATAMLAQANQTPQTILQLLR
jgi:flagellin